MKGTIMAVRAVNYRSARSSRAWQSLLMAAAWLVLGMASAHAGNTVTKVTLVMTDAQGNVLMTTDVHGNITARYTYRPYGMQQSGPTNKGPSYTGHVNDPDTGLVYMQQRYYDPDGRFISPDPIAPTPGDIYNFNRYAYANNNPITNIDPDGRKCFMGDGTHCDPKPTPPPSPSSQPSTPPPPPPPPETTATTLASVTVTATALPASGSIAWGAVGEGGAEITGGIFSSVVAPVVVVAGWFWPTKMGAASCEMYPPSPCTYNIMYSKGGRQNVRDTGLIGVSDEEINRRLKDPTTPSAEKKRLQKEQKARGQRNRRKRGR